MADNFTGAINKMYEVEKAEDEVTGAKYESDTMKVDECHIEDAEGDEYIETRCGIGTCRPRLLQKVNNPPVLLTCLCVYTLIHGKIRLNIFPSIQTLYNNHAFMYYELSTTCC